MATKRLPDSLKEASEFQLSNITNDTYIPLFTKSGNAEVMRKIKASVLNNGGGSSTPSAQPDRVIIIDSSLENNIEGKAYKTFAEAKTYMEANPTLYFQVELSAGEFSEQITLSDNWHVHGNSTIITSVLNTNVSVMTSAYMLSHDLTPHISDCTIETGGFASGGDSKEDYTFFILKDCNVTNMNISSKTVIYATNTNFISYHNNLYSADGMLRVYGGNLADIETNANCTFFNCSILGNITCNENDAYFFNCLSDISDMMTESYTITLYGDVIIDSCKFVVPTIFTYTIMESFCYPVFKNCTGNIGFSIDGSSLSYKREWDFINCNLTLTTLEFTTNTKIVFGSIGWMFVNSTFQSLTNINNIKIQSMCSYLTFDECEVLTISADGKSTISLRNSTINGLLCAAANTRVIRSYTTSSGVDCQPKHIVYSEDANHETITNDPSYAMWVGFIKNPEAINISEPSSDLYFWLEF